MGEAKRRQQSDPSYGTHMTYLELPYTTRLVKQEELRKFIKILKEYVKNNAIYSIVVFDNNERWKKIERLCYFVGMKKIQDHNSSLYGTSSIFVSNLTFRRQYKKVR